MASELPTKIRLVRCPKCKKILPELPDFTVYQCGGCGATLQAKCRANIATSAESDINPAEAVQENQTKHVHEEKEEPDLRNKDVIPCSEECSSCQNDESDQSKSGDCDVEQTRVVKLTSEDQNNENRRSDSSDSDNEGSEVSNEVFSPTEFFDDKGEEFVPNGNAEQANNDKAGDESFADHEFARNENEAAVDEDKEEESGDYENEPRDDLGNEDFSHPEFEEFTHNENEGFAQFENEESSREFVPGECAQNENEESSRVLVHGDNEDISREFSNAENEDSSREFIHDDNEDFSQEFGQTEDEEFGRDQTAETACTVNGLLSSPRKDPEPAVNEESSSLAKATTDDAINGENGSDYKVGIPSAVRFAAAIAGSVSSASDHVPVTESLTSPRSALKQPQNGTPQACGRLRSVEFNPSSELSGDLGETSKSPTRSSHSYYGLDDQERTRRDKFMAQAMMNRDSDAQHEGRHSFSDKNNPGLRNNNWDRDEFLERPARSWRLERHDRPSSSSAFLPRGDYENRDPSNRLQEKFQRHSSFQSDFSEDPEQMMKLLRMVLEIQNQSRNSGPLYDPVNNRTPGLSPRPRYDHHHNHRFHDFDAPREAHFRHPNDPRYLARYGSGSNYAHRYLPKKIPFSGDPTGSSHQLDPSCAHCFPRDWPRSGQLPPHNASGPCRIHPGHTHYAAFPPSPQWSINSEYHRPPPRRSHRAVAKRHFRPVARGAPFVACYKCSSVLQLPADFLLFKKKCHRVRCGACSRVLEFSLEKGSRVVRYKDKKAAMVANLDADAPPPSLAESNEAMKMMPDGREASSVPTALGRAFDRIIFGAAYPVEDSSKEFAPELSRERYKDRPPKPSSSNVTTKPEAEEDPQRSTSPLHRLMGYSSPSQVIYGSRPYGVGTIGSY